MGYYNKRKDFEEEEKTTVTAFNSALLSLNRLNICLVLCSENYKNLIIPRSIIWGDNSYQIENILFRYESYKKEVENLFSEIESKLEIKASKRISKRLEKISEHTNFFRKHNSDGINWYFIPNTNGMVLCVNVLRKIEIKLRRYADVKGLLIPEKQFEEDGL